MLYNDIKHKYDDDVRVALKYVLARCKIGDWFVLFQLNRNVNVYFYRAFIKELRNELRGNPKVRKKRIKKVTDCLLTLVSDFSEQGGSKTQAYMTSEMERIQRSPSIDAGIPDMVMPAAPKKDDGPTRSRAFLRIEHEHNLMPNLRMKGRGKKGKGKGKKRAGRMR